MNTFDGNRNCDNAKDDDDYSNTMNDDGNNIHD